MSFLKQMLRDIEETKSGRIRSMPGHWQLCPDETREPGNYPIPGKEDAPGMLDRIAHIRVDRHGRKMQLIRKWAVHCPNPEYIGQFAAIQDAGRPLCLSVAQAFCHKCRFYRPRSGARRSYPTCGFMAAVNPKLETVQEVAGIIKSARTMVEEIMGR